MLFIQKVILMLQGHNNISFCNNIQCSVGRDAVSISSINVTLESDSSLILARTAHRHESNLLQLECSSCNLYTHTENCATYIELYQSMYVVM